MRLQMRGISKRFGATAALSAVDIDLDAGLAHAVIGENGAGKSTLMRILAGACLPDAGEMLLDDRPYRPRNPSDGRRGGIAMIYQELALAPHLTVAENISLGAEPVLGPFVRRSATRHIAERALRAIGASAIRPGAVVGGLSAAQQQLVEIARAVALGARVLVLDEPTSSLSQSEVGALFELIRRLKSDGVGVLFVSHVLEEVRAICDRFTVLRDGGVSGRGAVADASNDAIVAMMVGRTIGELYPRSPRTPGDVAVELRNVAGSKQPRSASLQVRRGEIVGIAGLLGAGRTELLRVVFGLNRLRRGTIEIRPVSPDAADDPALGVFVGSGSPAQRWAQSVGLVSEDRKNEGLALKLRIAENLTMPRLEGLGPLGLITRRAQHRAAAGWIDRLNIRCLSPAQRTGSLSGGNQQKVALARLLHADCDILLLDEPTRGIDVASKAEIYRLLDDLVRPADGTRPPRAVLIVSSYLPELLGICDRIAVMHRGTLGPARPVGELSEQSIMREAIGSGESA